MPSRTLDVFPASYFRRHDERDDHIFYSLIREKPYLADGALDAFHLLVCRLLPPTTTLLDVAAGAHSYLPPALDCLHVTGVGLNASEMARNPHLDEILVQDLNRNPQLRFADETFDAALCTCGVQYFTKPLEIFCEVNRVLKPSGIFLVSFTKACFLKKAISLWLATRSRQHQLIVRRYFEVAGNWRDVGATPNQWPLDVRENHQFFAVWATKELPSVG